MTQAAPQSSPERSLTDIDKVPVAFCDSAAGLRTLCDAGLAPSARVRTSAPYLLVNHPDRTEHLEAVISAETAARFKSSIRGFVTRIYDTAISHDATRGYARTLARATALFHRTVYKASCLTEDDFLEPRIVAQVSTGQPDTDSRLNPPWNLLLAGNHQLQVLNVVFQPKPASGPQDIDRLRRWLFRGLGYLGFRIGQSLSLHAPLLFRHDRVAFVLKENELVHETAFQLARRRIPLEALGRTRFSGLEPDPALTIDDHVWATIAENYQEHLSRFLCDSARDKCVDLAIEELRQHAVRQAVATQHYSNLLGRESRRAMILTNYPGSPEEYGLFIAGHRATIPVIAFQHGISRELNEVHGDLGVENSSAHLTAVYNETGKRRTDATQFHHGASMAVGFPDKGRRLKHLPVWCFKKSEPVLYVSMNLYRGTVNTVSGSYSDLDSCRAETEMIETVLRRLPYRVSYKPYPEALHYVDPDPVLERARRCDNVTVIEGSVDLRYFLRAASVVVTSRASSTTGWCILSGVPFCFVDVPEQMPLAGEAKDAFKAAFFYFTMTDPDVHTQLRDFLSQPLASIRTQWRQKEAARQQFKQVFIDKPTPSAGSVLAGYLTKHAFEPEFCADNAFAPPLRYDRETTAGSRSGQ